MGKRIRIGNDIPISWTLTTGGEAYDLTGKTFEVRMVNLGKVIAVASPAVTGNVLTWTFYGAEQRYLGPYDLLFVENPGAHEMVTFDVRAPFVLVAHSWETGGTTRVPSASAPQAGQQRIPSGSSAPHDLQYAMISTSFFHDYSRANHSLFPPVWWEQGAMLKDFAQ